MSQYPNLPHSHNSLKVFESVARLMSFTHAASELNVTQSAVSRQIKSLEEELNIGLIIRQHRTIALTEKGQQLYAALQQNYQQLDALISQWKVPEKKRLVIKSALSYATRCLIPKVMELNERYPEHEIVIVPAIEEDPDLLQQQCDLLILNTRQAERYRGVENATFLRQEYMAPVCASSEGHNHYQLEEVLAMTRLHATIDHLDWNAWLAVNDISNAKPKRETSFVTLDLAMSACLAGQGATVTDLLLVLSELDIGFLQSPIGTKLCPSSWQYHCYQPNPSPVSQDLLIWLQQQTEKEVEKLERLASKYQWKFS